MGVAAAVAAAIALAVSPAQFLQAHASDGAFAEPGGTADAALTVVGRARPALGAAPTLPGRSRTCRRTSRRSARRPTSRSSRSPSRRSATTPTALLAAAPGGAAPERADRRDAELDDAGRCWRSGARRAATTRFVLAHQARSGGFSWAVGGQPDSNDTAAALETLRVARVTGRPVARAVAFLLGFQRPERRLRAHARPRSDAQSTAWAIQGLVAAGRKPPRCRVRLSREAEAAGRQLPLLGRVRDHAGLGDVAGPGRAGEEAVPARPLTAPRARDRCLAPGPGRKRQAARAPAAILSRCSATLLTIGNELVSGDVPNTNASWLARRLELLGVQVVLSASVPDELDRIVDFVRRERRPRRPSHRHRRARRDARRHHPRGGRGRVRRRAARRARARRRLAGALPRRPRVRGAVGGAPRGRAPAREPARRGAGVPARERLGAARACRARWRRCSTATRTSSAPAGRSASGAARMRPASRRSPRRSSTATARWPTVQRRLVSRASRRTGREVEIVLKSADPDALAAASGWLEAELDRLT